MKSNRSSLSPLLRHALESFKHGMDHFREGSDSSRNFALLHIDQAIELLIKEKLVRLGKSIYKGDGTTMNLHEAFNSITKDVLIPERPRLESLHELRNNVQHTGLTIDILTTAFYMTEAYNFVVRFLSVELDIKISEYFSGDLLLSAIKAISVDSTTPNPNSIVDWPRTYKLERIPLKDSEEYVDIPRTFLPKITKDLFAYRIPTDEMKDAALVYKDDILILRSLSQVQNGEMCLYRTPDGNLKLRYFYIEGEKIRLQPANPNVEPEFSLRNEVEIIGKVILVIRPVRVV
jgi:hypothetical protein